MSSHFRDGTLGGTEKWGLEEKIGKVFLEPYSYASALTDASFEAIDNLADCTEVTRLFPSGHPIPPLIDKAPKGSIFEFGKRFSIMA